MNEPRYRDIPAKDISFESRAEEIESAISFFKLLLSYHQRVCIASDPNFLASTYERNITTAIECLEKERALLS